MEQQPSVFLSLIPLLVLTIPIVIMNIFIANRKGKNPILYGALSLIFFAGFYLSIYLMSLTDKSLNDKIDKILQLLETRG